MTSTATKRLQKEIVKMQKFSDKDKTIYAAPDGDDLFKWFYVVRGAPGTVYEGGTYLGSLHFPKEYPFKPPGIKISTPNGRFTTDYRLCLSISDYHPESWDPTWNIELILIGLQSFMSSEDNTLGAENHCDEERRRLALASHVWNVKKTDKFKTLFPALYTEESAKAEEETCKEAAKKGFEVDPKLDAKHLKPRNQKRGRDD